MLSHYDYVPKGTLLVQQKLGRRDVELNGKIRDCLLYASGTEELRNIRVGVGEV